MKKIAVLSSIGVDEAGRGCLAGPVVAAAVMLSKGFDTQGIADSKVLSEKQRNLQYSRLLEAEKDGLAYIGLGTASVEEVNRVNILQATMNAMHLALADVFAKIEKEKNKFAPKSANSFTILIDGSYFVSQQYRNFQTVIGGDGLHACIGAASIIAKVSRDTMMFAADKEHPQYGFAKHKGYATRQHREAIMRYGVCPLHRALFVRNVLARKEQENLGFSFV